MGHINKTLLIALAALTMAACAPTNPPKTSPVDKILKENGARTTAFVGKDNKLQVIDVKDGKLIPPCSQRPANGFAKCRSPFDLEKLAGMHGKQGMLDKQSLAATARDGKGPVIRYMQDWLIIEWVGSTCITYYDRATGREIEYCW